MNSLPPIPPPHASLPSMSYGHIDLSNGQQGRKELGSNHGIKAPARPLLHLKDLVASAQNQVDPYAPISKLLARFNHALNQARALQEFGRLDYAFVEYHVATLIAVNIIPRHKDYPNLQTQARRDLTHRIHNEQERFERIRDIIIADNRRYGTQPAVILSSEQQQTTTSNSRSPVSSLSHNLESRPMSMQFANSNERVVLSSDRNHRQSVGVSVKKEDPPPSSIVSRSRPPIQPKPLNLLGTNLHSDNDRFSHESRSTEDDALAQRFSQFRLTNGYRDYEATSTGPPDLSYSPRPSDSLSDTSRSATSVIFSGSTDSLGLTSSQLRRTALNGASQQNGFAINTLITKDLPKPPSPTYSPIRTTGAAIQPPRSTRSSAYAVGERPGSSSSTRSSTLKQEKSQPSLDNDPYTTAEYGLTPNGQAVITRRRRKSLNMPAETEITAQKLFDYLRKFSVLVVDVRNREDYDSGHIWAQASICVEPAALREGMSADELQEALILSPDVEQDLLRRRDEFDLVVYHDDSTRTIDFLSARSFRSQNASLKYLQNALYEFNQECPLRWPPILLIGGMEEWINLVGVHALSVSNTAGRPKGSRPIVRRPVGSSSSRLSIQKKRHREYNPLEPEEERKWRERARSESVSLDAQPLPQGENDSEPYVRNYEDFYRRFPEVASWEQQSMMSTVPTRKPPPPPVSEFITPHAPLPSSGVPSRPPPAVPRRSYSGISEKITSPITAVTRTAQLPAYIPPRLSRIPRVGLHNFGVTCYMNATIQCLSATIPLTVFFLDGQWKKFLQKENWKGSKGIIPDFYEVLLRNLWLSKDVDTIRPTNFRKFCARLNKEWGLDRQQDAKEFLDFLVDCLHEDFNVNWARNPVRALTVEEEAYRERMPNFVASKLEWDRFLHRDSSRITELFAGQHISRLQCRTCHNSSTTYEPFYSVSVEIPSTPQNKRVDIRDCLRSYCSAEMLSGDEVWRCPHCRTEREATKRITISRAPDCLVVHLKRFSASHTERARKIHTPVDFPLKGLDLAPFMLPSPDDQLHDHIARHYSANDLETPPSMQPPYRYDAYAVMRHIGSTMTSGHYTSLVEDRARDCWREFNDDRVTDFRPEDLSSGRRLQNEQAYIIFYRRVHE